MEPGRTCSPREPRLTYARTRLPRRMPRMFVPAATTNSAGSSVELDLQRRPKPAQSPPATDSKEAPGLERAAGAPALPMSAVAIALFEQGSREERGHGVQPCP
jgi:hypothetical protein